MFDTKRPPVGELLYQLKYGRAQTKVEKLAIADQLAETAENFIRNTWRAPIDAICLCRRRMSERSSRSWLWRKPLAARLGVPVARAA